MRGQQEGESQKIVTVFLLAQSILNSLLQCKDWWVKLLFSEWRNVHLNLFRRNWIQISHLLG